LADASKLISALNKGPARLLSGGGARPRDPTAGFVAWVVLPTIVVFFSVCGLFFLALQVMSGEMNSIDAERSRTALEAAIDSLVEGLDEAVADEATWTEGYINTYVTPNPAWQDASWGSTARLGGTYDTAVITDADGVIVFGESSRGPITGKLADLVSGSAELLHKLEQERSEMADDASVANLGRSGDNVIAIAGMVIHGNTGQPSVPREDRRILWLAQRMDDAMLQHTATRFLLPLPRLNAHAEGGEMSTELVDAAGTEIATISWMPRMPGEAAYSHTASLASVVMVLIAGLTAAVLVAFHASLRSRAEADEREWYSARYDEVTGLFTRFGLEENLRQILPKRKLETRLAVAQIGVDAFSEVVGTYGRECGDLLLDALAGRIEQVTAGKASLARGGAAEFMLARPGDNGMELIRNATVKLLALTGEPLIVGDLKIKAGLSIGLAEAVSTRDSVATVVRMAETALARARETGGNQMIEYESAIEVERRLRLELQADIRRGLEADEFALEYQPIVDFASRKVLGVEALLRWPNRPGGPIGPANFIPVAESSGLIDDLGIFALRRAIADIAPLDGLKVSVNVSAVQLRNPAFAETVRAVLDEVGMDPARLQLELTETFLITQPARARRVIDSLRALGTTIALDDFGTGYSSIGYLRQFAFDRVKLDRSLVTDIDTNPIGGAMVEATMTYAYAMNLAVTAEGVERIEEASVLARLGCREFQGYLFARPLQLDALRLLMEEGAQLRVG
jgi:diguanylate cyclase (GGDEF)-like protein